MVSYFATSVFLGTRVLLIVAVWRPTTAGLFHSDMVTRWLPHSPICAQADAELFNNILHNGKHLLCHGMHQKAVSNIPSVTAVRTSSFQFAPLLSIKITF